MEETAAVLELSPQSGMRDWERLTALQPSWQPLTVRLLTVILLLLPALAAAAPAISIAGPIAAGSAATSIAAGLYHTCAIRNTGNLSCWGDNLNGNAVPGGLFVQVAAQGTQTCAMRSDNSVVCWGNPTDGALAAGSATAGKALLQIAVGAQGGCALGLNGFATCWGRDTNGSTRPPAVRFRQIAVGSVHACGILFEGGVRCWGSGSTATAAGLTSAPAGLFREIAAGSEFTCAIDDAGAIRCWGANQAGQSSPPGGAFRQLTAGADHACAIAEDGAAACWGRGRSNVAVGLSPDRGQAAPPAGRFLQLAAGGLHTCGIAETGAVACWGSNDSHDRGLRPNQTISPSGSFRHPAIATGEVYACLIDTGGRVRCFGESHRVPGPPPTGLFHQIGVDIFSACALSSVGEISCWGFNEPIPSGRFIDMAASGAAVCGIRSDGTLACTRHRLSFDYGQGSPPPGRFVRIGGEGFTFCAVRSDGRPVCWGKNSNANLFPCGQASSAPASYVHQISGGMLDSVAVQSTDLSARVTTWGCGAMTTGATPPPAGPFSQVSTGLLSACGLRPDGTAVCWGENQYGQRHAPGGTFKQIAASGVHACAVTTSSSVVCWGANISGQGSPPNPVQAAGGCSYITGSFSTDTYNDEGRLEFTLRASLANNRANGTFSFRKSGGGTGVAIPAATVPGATVQAIRERDSGATLFFQGAVTVGSRAIAEATVTVDVQGNTTLTPNSIRVRVSTEDEPDLWDSGTLPIPAGAIAVINGCAPETGFFNTAGEASDGIVSPGSMATLKAEELAFPVALASGMPISTRLNGVQLLVNGRFAPLYSLAPGKIVFQVPFETFPGLAEVRVLSAGRTVYTSELRVAPLAPGIFTADAFGQAVAWNEDLTLNSPASPAASDSVLTIYATGLGKTDPRPISGYPGSFIEPLMTALESPIVLIGGLPAEVLFAGIAPQYVGVYQVSVLLPAGVSAGAAVPIQILSGGAASNVATIVVRLPY
jgi:uncharacterized protein (TIGR03437 family)